MNKGARGDGLGARPATTVLRVACSVLLYAAIAGITLSSVTFLAGCGGSGGGTQSSTTGRATLTIIWPDRSRLIPAASNSIKVAINKGSTAITSNVVARPSGGGAVTI